MQVLLYCKNRRVRPRLNLKLTFLTMKMLSLLLLGASFQLCANGHGQTISLSLRDAPLQNIFKEIEKQTAFRFIYSKAAMDHATPVTISVQNETLEKVLSVCFQKQPLTYEIEEKFIIVKVITATSHSGVIVLDISGKVVSEKNEAVAGATVAVKGSDKSTATDSKGMFQLTTIDPNATIIVTGSEFLPTEVSLNGKTYLVITLVHKVGELDETMVVGYGTTTQRYSVGSVSKVNATVIAQQPVANPLAALQGRVPGLVVSSTSGIPGSAVKIQIRGQNSINPNPAASRINPLDNPLFIVDGVPFAPQNNNINQFSSMAAPPSGTTAIYNNPYGGLSPFNTINPADIESIEILRDAAETAIYGSRGANGVILITTKKGNPGKTHLGVNIYTGVSQVGKTMPLMNTDQYLQMRHEGFNNDGAVPSRDPASRAYAPDLLIFDTTQYTDWKDYFLGGTAQATDINLNVSGGSSTTQFLLGSGYHHESYIYPGDFGSSRASVNFNLHHQTSDKKLTLDFSANYSYMQNNSSGSENVLKAFTLAPDYPALLTPDGELNWSYGGYNMLDNPMAYLKQTYKATSYNLISHFQVGYSIAPWLMLKTSLGYNDLTGKENAQKPKSTQPPSNNPISYSNFGANNFRTWIIEPQVDFSHNIGKGRMIFTTGGTIQKNTTSSTITEASNFPNDALLGSVSAAGTIRSGDSFNEYRYAGWFGKLNFVWQSKYILTASGRRDGSSRFGPGKQYGNFGSAGMGWIFTEEPFVKHSIPVLSYGKFRSSYGTTGNDRIGDYQYLTRWAASGNPFEGSVGYQPQNLSNSEFSWSVTRKFEAGIDLGFFKDRLLLSATWFRNRCDNQLVSYALPSQAGFNGVTANFPALVQNQGWEFQLTSINWRKKNFQWRTTFNLSVTQNKLISFPGLQGSAYTNTYIVGQSMTVLNQYIYLGVDPGTGLYLYDSKTGAPTSSPNYSTDRHIIGNLDPKFFGGLDNQLAWKNLDIGLFFQFVDQFGPTYKQQIYAYIPSSGMVNMPTNVLNRWQKAGDMQEFQRYTYRKSGTNAANAGTEFPNSSGAYGDASYIRLKTLSVAYRLPESLLHKAKLQLCRVYINAQNLFTITSYEGNDPETQSFYSLPPLRTVVAGIQFTF